MAGKSSVGKRIRTFREERNVDLETLSQNTGLTVIFHAFQKIDGQIGRAHV